MSDPTEEIEADWSALEWLEMAENRLECALMGDEVCKECVDVALSYVKEAAALVRANQTGGDGE